MAKTRVFRRVSEAAGLIWDIENAENFRHPSKALPNSLILVHLFQEVCVSGGLAPFDEVSVAFRGPLNLHNIAWYEGTADETLERTSLWSRG